MEIEKASVDDIEIVQETIDIAGEKTEWFKISSDMVEGLTREEAIEKISRIVEKLKQSPEPKSELINGGWIPTQEQRDNAKTIDGLDDVFTMLDL